jgi:hypothetical protein
LAMPSQSIALPALTATSTTFFPLPLIFHGPPLDPPSNLPESRRLPSFAPPPPPRCAPTAQGNGVCWGWPGDALGVGEKRVFGGFNWAVRKNNEPPWLRSKMGRVRVKS